MSQPAAYDLYLDESGLFLETSTDPAEVAASLRRPALPQPACRPPRPARCPDRRRGPHPPAAVPRRSRPAALAPARHRPTRRRSLRPPRSRSAGPAAGRLAAGAARESGACPLRRSGDDLHEPRRRTVAARLPAEAEGGQDRVSLRLYCARVVLGEAADGTIRFLERPDYLRRMTEYLGQAAVRLGFARESAAWRLDELHLRSGKDDLEIQLCDLVSNASHDDFRRCGPDAAAALRQALGAYDFSLVYRELLERVDQHLADGSLGLALMALAERLRRTT